MKTRKPREGSLLLDFGKPVRVDRVGLTSEGEVLFETGDGQMLRPVRTFLETSYERSKGPKVLNRLVPPTDRLFLDPWHGIAKYKRLFAIDTNSRFVGSERVAVTGIVEFIPLVSKRSALIFPRRAIELRNVTALYPERVGWLRAIDLLVSELGFALLQVPVGLIVDSDLANLERFNLRLMPLGGDRYLPQNMEFIYATSDAGKEHPLNRAIAEADKIAAGTFAHLANIGDDRRDFRDARPDEGYSRWRHWIVRESPS
jgi:hypothetical protein